MLCNFKLQVETELGSKVENTELLRAIEMTKSDVVSNNLVMGKDVTADYFREVVARCITIMRKMDSPVGISQPTQICPDCKSILIPEGGCTFCPNCGYSPCK